MPNLLTLIAETRGLFDRLRNDLTPYQAQAEQIGANGWILPMWFTLDDFQRIGSPVSPDAIDDYFLQMYSPEGGSRRWKLLQASRCDLKPTALLPLFDECVWAFEHQRYRLVIPGLLVIVEGLFYENSASTNIDHKAVTAGWRRAAEKDPLTWLLLISAEAFIKKLFASHRGPAHPPQLNRNWILHGRDSPDWTESDALRLFQAISTLSRIRDYFV